MGLISLISDCPRAVVVRLAALHALSPPQTLSSFLFLALERAHLLCEWQAGVVTRWNRAWKTPLTRPVSALPSFVLSLSNFLANEKRGKSCYTMQSNPFF